MSFPFPGEVQMDAIPEDATLDGLLEISELDALVTVRAPDSYRTGSPKVNRLFPRYREVEEDYFKRESHFPIMHTVVLRRDIYEANTGLALTLLDAFQKAKEWGLARLCDLNVLAIVDPWLGADLDEFSRVFHGDPFVYGYRANLGTIEATTRYSFEQGLSRRKVEPVELFAEETLEWEAPPDYLRQNRW